MCGAIGERRRMMVKRRTVKRKPPSPKAKKTIVKGVIKDAKKLQSALSKGKKKKFQAALGRLSAAMRYIDMTQHK
jgi:hypothetical protein